MLIAAKLKCVKYRSRQMWNNVMLQCAGSVFQFSSTVFMSKIQFGKLFSRFTLERNTLPDMTLSNSFYSLLKEKKKKKGQNSHNNLCCGKHCHGAQRSLTSNGSQNMSLNDLSLSLMAICLSELHPFSSLC